MKSLVHEIKQLGIKSIAIPPLGCGLGGLDWNEVRMKIAQACAGLYEVHVMVFEPGHFYSPPVRQTIIPKMTRGRAIFIKLIESYREFNYRLSLLEIQKLAYQRKSHHFGIGHE